MKKQVRTKSITIKLTTDEFERFQAQAYNNGLTVSAYLRLLVAKDAHQSK